jgi:glycosyltransferase involved in cell wall biosynthesis
VSARRTAIYDAYWSTAGGGEKYAAGVADVLSRTDHVTLLAHEPVDTAWLGERLSLDLSRVEVGLVEPTCDMAEVTSAFDLFVNLSYRSHHRNGARHGVYVVHFPDRPDEVPSGWQAVLQDRVRPALSRAPGVTFRSGFHEPDVIRWQRVRWTDGAGVLVADIPPGATRVVHLRFGRFVPGGAGRHIEVRVDGRTVARAELAAPTGKADVIEPLHLAVAVPGRTGGVPLEIVSESSVADDVLGNGDVRRLGVPLVHAAVGWRPLDAVRARASLVDDRPIGLGWLDSYHLVVANSPYTQRWIEQWWHRPSTVLEPPVGLRSTSSHEPLILSVGRFFAPGRGHAKKQLEMVHAFRRLVAEGVRGWELHLVGGCSDADRAYVDEVRAAAAGLPVFLHVDASGQEVDELYRRASIYWHATGMGEDVDADPVRAEHFGITTVEAMSAGAVPVVIDAGGQPDIVTDGVDGLLFRSEDELVAATRSLVDDPDLRRRLGKAAAEAAAGYGLEAFGGRLRALVDGL